MEDKEKIYELNPENYRKILETEWADFHHSRLQEWTAFGIVAGIHLGIITLIDVFSKANNSHIDNAYIFIGAFVGIVFSVLGGLITCRHERVKKIKIKHIARAEYFLDLIRFEKAGEKSKEDGANKEGSQFDRNPKIIWFESKNGEKDLWKDIPWKGISIPRPLSTSGLILCLYVFLILVDIGILFHKINP